MTIHHAGYNPGYQPSYGNHYSNSYSNSYSHSYSTPPQYSSSHNSYSHGYSNSHSQGYPGGHYGHHNLMGQIGGMVSNIIGSIEQQRQTGYGLSQYPPSYPHYGQTQGCGSCHGSGHYYPHYIPPSQYLPGHDYPYPGGSPGFNIYDQYNPHFDRPISEHTGGGEFNGQFTDYRIGDNGGNDLFKIDGYQNKFTFTGDEGPNSFRVRGESNLIRIKNLGADDTVSVYNYEDLIILGEKETEDGHAVSLLDPHSGNRIILYSDQADRGTDFLLERLAPDYYTGLLPDEG